MKGSWGGTDSFDDSSLQFLKVLLRIVLKSEFYFALLY